MSNYLIDASVYALPQNNSNLTDNQKSSIYEKYLEQLNKTFSLIFSDIDINYSLKLKKSFDINYFMFSEYDINMLIENDLIWNINTIKNIKNMKISKINDYTIEYLGKIIIDLIPKLQTRSKSINKSKYKPCKICTLETITGIKNIKINENNTYLPEIKINSNTLLELYLKKNICKLAFLNKIIYMNNNITKMITNNNIKEYKIKGKINKIQHNLNIDKYSEIDISDIEVINFIPDKIEEKSYSIVDIFKQPNMYFKNIIINENVFNSITLFLNNVKSVKSSIVDLKFQIESYLTNYQKIIFDCITILDYLVEYNLNNQNQKRRKYITKENYCKSIEYDQTCKKCCGFLKICGFDCSTGEKKIINGKPYYLHLKPYTSGNESYKDLTLRIYFKFDKKFKNIEIGHIGGHL